MLRTIGFMLTVMRARAAAPRRGLRMSYCNQCLDGPFDPSGVVMEWGMSRQAWGEDNLIGPPAVFDLQAGTGRLIAFNFNPLHRDLNRGDQRILGNALLNWQTI